MSRTIKFLIEAEFSDIISRESLYKSVMNMIVKANMEVFKEARDMCEALRELMKEELEEREKAGRIEGERFGRIEGERFGRIEGEKVGRIEGERNVKIQLIRTKLSKGKTVETIAEDLEESVEYILKLMKEMDANDFKENTKIVR